MVELNMMILDEDMEKIFELMESENMCMSGNDYAKEILLQEIRYRYRMMKQKERNGLLE